MKGDVRWGESQAREGQLAKLVGDQNLSPEALPMSERRQEKREQKRCQERATARIAMEKSRYVRIIERKGVRGDDPVEHFLPMGVRSTF